MKLSGREAARYLATPDPAGTGALLFGADATRVALKRAALVTAMIGPDGAAEMRLTRITGADLRRDPAALEDALKAIGFFPGPRAVLVEEATDGLAPLVATALGGWRP
ncbi:MAG: DNA polymerase III subunit delta, partial [Amaricoccus sp.]